MQELIGKKIVKVERTKDEGALVFFDDTGKTYTYEAFGDCCSYSWFSHISGINSLLGGTVTAVNTMEFSDEDQKAAEAEGEYDSLALYGYKLLTEKGYCSVEFRNDSNGYYGGECELTRKYATLKDLEEVTADY